MFNAIQFGVGLVALLVMLLPALAYKQHWSVIREDWRQPLRVLFGVLESELGSQVTYCTPPYTPSTTALTSVQAAITPTQTFQVFWADTDSGSLQITHNWQLPQSYPTWLLPEIQCVKQLGGASDLSFATNFTFGIANTNAVFMNKVTIGTGTGGTYIVTLRRGDGPWR